LTLIESIKKAIKRGGSDLKHACLTLDLVIVTLGVEGTFYFKEIYELLQHEITRGSNNEERAHCINSLGIACFVWGDPENTRNCCDIFVNIINTANDIHLLTCAVHQWLLLYTTLSDDDLLYFVENDINFENIMELIKRDDYELKYAASQALAYFSVVLKNTNEQEYDLSLFEPFIDVYSYINILNSTKPSKKYAGRPDTRDVVNTLKDGSQPQQFLTIKGQKIVVDHWEQHIQLDVFREILRNGIQVHFENNPLIWDIFDVEFQDDIPILNKYEKKMLYSKSSIASKRRTNEIKKGRGDKDKRRIGEDE